MRIDENKNTLNNFDYADCVYVRWEATGSMILEGFSMNGHLNIFR